MEGKGVLKDVLHGRERLVLVLEDISHPWGHTDSPPQITWSIYTNGEDEKIYVLELPISTDSFLENLIENLHSDKEKFFVHDIYCDLASDDISYIQLKFTRVAPLFYVEVEWANMWDEEISSLEEAGIENVDIVWDYPEYQRFSFYTSPEYIREFAMPLIGAIRRRKTKLGC